MTETPEPLDVIGETALELAARIAAEREAVIKIRIAQGRCLTVLHTEGRPTLDRWCIRHVHGARLDHDFGQGAVTAMDGGELPRFSQRIAMPTQTGPEVHDKMFGNDAPIGMSEKLADLPYRGLSVQLSTYADSEPAARRLRDAFNDVADSVMMRRFDLRGVFGAAMRDGTGIGPASVFAHAARQILTAATLAGTATWTTLAVERMQRLRAVADGDLEGLNDALEDAVAVLLEWQESVVYRLFAIAQAERLRTATEGPSL